MNLEPGKRRGPPPPMYRSPLHGPVRGEGGREREWLRYQIQAHHPKRYWEPVAESDDRNRALLEALKRARVGKVGYRVWDRVDRREIWQGYGPHASIDEWLKERPPGLVGQNSRDKSGIGKRGRFSYIIMVAKGWFGPFLTKERAMSRLANLRRKIRAGVPSPLYEGQGEPVIGQARRSPDGWEYALPGTQAVTYHWDKARAAIIRAIARRPRPNERRTAMSVTVRPARLRVNPVLSRRMQPLRPGTMRLGDAMRYGKALVESGYVIRLWDGSGWEVVIHPNDSLATMSGKGSSGGLSYLAQGAGMVKTWPITLIAYRGQQSLGVMTPPKVRHLLAKARVSANPNSGDAPTFHVMHISVDGAGWSARDISEKRRAIAAAQRFQAKADRRGNRWGYHYVVYRSYPSGRSDAIYRTKSKATANWNGKGRGKHSARMNSLACANERTAHKEIVDAFMAGRSRHFGTSREMPGSRYATDGRQLKVWGHVVAEKVPGGIRLTDAGYQTLLTRNVLNTVLDRLGRSRIYQSKFQWYIGSTPWEGQATFPTGGAMTNRRGTRARRNSFGKTPYYQIKGEIHHWDSGQKATLPRGKTLVTVYLPGVDATVFETWIEGGERCWRAVRLHRHHGNPRAPGNGGAWYYGYKKSGGVEKFWSRRKPSVSSHGGRYSAVTGPFRTPKAMDKMYGFWWQRGPHTIVRRGKVRVATNSKLLGKRGAKSAMRFA
jgi:hypothetical protein